MSDELNELPLWGWAASRPEAKEAEIVDLAHVRESSARWKLAIAPRAIGALLRFDRMTGLAPTPPVAHFADFRPLRRV